MDKKEQAAYVRAERLFEKELDRLREELEAAQLRFRRIAWPDRGMTKADMQSIAQEGARSAGHVLLFDGTILPFSDEWN